MDKYRPVEDEHCKALRTFEQEVRAKRESLERRIRKEHDDQLLKLRGACDALEDAFQNDKECFRERKKKIDANNVAIHNEINLSLPTLDKEALKLQEAQRCELERIRSAFSLYETEIGKHFGVMERCEELIGKERFAMEKESGRIRGNISVITNAVQKSRNDCSKKLSQLEQQIKDRKVDSIRESEKINRLLKQKQDELNLKDEELKHQDSTFDASLCELRSELQRVRDQMLKETDDPPISRKELAIEMQKLRAAKNSIKKSTPAGEFVAAVERELRSVEAKTKGNLERDNDVFACRLREVANALAKNESEQARLVREFEQQLNAFKIEKKRVEQKYSTMPTEFTRVTVLEADELSKVHEEEKGKLEEKLEMVLEEHSRLRSKFKEEVAKKKDLLAMERLEADKAKMTQVSHSDGRYSRIGELQALIDEEKCKIKSLRQSFGLDLPSTTEKVQSEHLRRKLEHSEKLRQAQIVLSQLKSNVKREKIDLERRELSIQQYIQDVLIAERDSNRKLAAYIRQLQGEVVDVETQQAKLRDKLFAFEKGGHAMIAKNREHRNSCREKAAAAVAQENMNLQDRSRLLHVFVKCFDEVIKGLGEQTLTGAAVGEGELPNELLIRRNELKAELEKNRHKEKVLIERQKLELDEFRDRMEGKVKTLKQDAREAERKVAGALEAASHQQGVDIELLKKMHEEMTVSNRVSRLKESINDVSRSKAKNVAKVQALRSTNEDVKRKRTKLREKKLDFARSTDSQIAQLRTSGTSSNAKRNASQTNQRTRQKELQNKINLILSSFRGANERNAVLSVTSNGAQNSDKAPKGNAFLSLENLDTPATEHAIYSREAKLAAIGLQEIQTDVSNLARGLERLRALTERKLEKLKDELTGKTK